MKYHIIKEKLEGLKLFTIEDLHLFDPLFRDETLYEWEKKGWVIKLRNKRYIFSDYTPSNHELYMIANKLYSPSYISLELALNHYGVIPEAVSRVISVTTNKTLLIGNKVGDFDYKTIDKKMFFGYLIINTESVSYKIASLEKALIDYLYLNSKIETTNDFENLRFNQELLNESLKPAKILEMASIINSKILSKRVNLLLNYIQS